MDDFTDIKFTGRTLDIFYIRQSIFNAIKKNSLKFKGNLLDVGCGKMPYKNFLLGNSDINKYVGLDIETALEYDNYIKPDLTWDGKKMPVDDNSFETIIATEVLEHCFEPDVILKEIYRVLKPNGVFFFTVPFLWNLHETPNDAYRYTPFSIEKHLLNSGFNEINLSATGGWHAAMAQMIGLWIKRSSMSPRKRKFLTYLGLKIMPYLIKMDTPSISSFKEGEMITGLTGIAIKNSL